MKNYKLIKYLFILLVINTSCSDLLIQPEDDTALKMEDFNAIRDIVEENYPYLDFKNIDWDEVYNEYLPRIANSKGDEYLNEIVSFLGELEDGHVGYQLKSGYVRTYDLPRVLEDKFTYKPELVRSYFDSELILTGNNHINYGKAADNIGYIRIETFDNEDRFWVHDIDQAFIDLKSTDGLIIDVRHNGGGCTCVANYVTRRFLNEPLKLPGVIRKGVFYEEEEPLTPHTPVPYENNVVVLINGVSFSATEVFARDMKTIDRVTLIGKTTAGGGGATQYFDLPSSAQIRLTFQNSLKYDKTPIEWNGITPDIVIEQSKDDVENGIDKQFEYAIQFLKDK